MTSDLEVISANNPPEATSKNLYSLQHPGQQCGATHPSCSHQKWVASDSFSEFWSQIPESRCVLQHEKVRCEEFHRGVARRKRFDEYWGDVVDARARANQWNSRYGHKIPEECARVHWPAPDEAHESWEKRTWGDYMAVPTPSNSHSDWVRDELSEYLSLVNQRHRLREKKREEQKKFLWLIAGALILALIIFLARNGDSSSSSFQQEEEFRPYSGQ